MKHGKKYRESLKKYDSMQEYDLVKACELVKELKFTKFDETVEVHVNLKLSKSQTVRDTVVLPNQFRGEKKVLVFCKDDRAQEALAPGRLRWSRRIYRRLGRLARFRYRSRYPDMMKDVGRLGMVLGRKGLCPIRRPEP